MYLNFIEILSIVLLVLGSILLIIGKFKKIKCIWITGIIFFFIIWSMIFIEKCSEKAPDFNQESNYTFQEEVSKDDTALVKVRYGDLIGNDLTNETFETLIEFDSNTKFYSKGGNINSINDLETAKYNINSIVLDINTINKKNPAIVTIFDSSDT